MLTFTGIAFPRSIDETQWPRLAMSLTMPT